ncbi:MAG: hypothetical protein Q8M66_02490 [Actinomycetota bacterium]|nr:hypothetical protein [Actinomycetota bacterium]MDZ4179655.1 hypothetical protein [Coriobacteriia bacterium]
MNEGNSLRDLLWDSLLTADLNHRYHGTVSDYLQRWDKRAKIFVAIMSSTAVAGWAIWSNVGFSTVWTIAGGLAALVAIAQPILDPARSIKTSGQLSGAWFSILRDYELLWTTVDDSDDNNIRERLVPIFAEEKRLTELETTLSKRKRLARQCENEVRVSRGLDNNRVV